jgi:hypothetical protein
MVGIVSVEMKTLLLFVAAIFVAGCPPSEKKNDPAKQEGCTRVGQNCEFSPGKLGTCVAKDGCTEASPSCFSCQSQH